MPAKTAAPVCADALPLRAEAAWSLAGEGPRALFFEARHEEALAALNDAIALDRRSGRLYALRAEAERTPVVAQYSRSLEDLEKAAELEPGTAWMLGYHAKALAQSGRFAEAQERLGQALKLAPEYAWILAEKALVSLAQNRVEQGLCDARRAQELNASSALCRLALAACLRRSGENSRALEALEGVVGLTEAGEGRAVEGCRPPDPDELRFELCRALGDYRGAAASLERAARAGRRIPWTQDWEGPHALERGLGEVDRALAACGPGPWLHFWRGGILAGLGRHKEAFRDLEAALGADPSFSRAWALKAWLGILAAQPKNALRDAEKALELSPDRVSRAQLLGLKARALAALENCKEAGAQLAKALELAPDNFAYRLNKAELGLAMGRITEAEEDSRLALDLRPADARGLLLRSQLRLLRGNAEGALSDLGQALRADGGFAYERIRGLRRRMSNSSAERLDAAGCWRVEFSGPFCQPPRLEWQKPQDIPSGPFRQGRPPRPRRGGDLGRAGVDPCVELAGLLKLLLTRDPAPAAVFNRASCDPSFLDRVLERFSPFVDEALLESFRGVAEASGNRNFPWLGITQMMLGLSEPPRLAVRTTAWHRGEDLELLRRIREFVVRSDYMEFFRSSSDFFESWAAPARSVVEGEAYCDTVSAYIGVELGAFYDLVISTLLRDVDLDALLEFNDGSRGARSVVCPLSSEPAYERAYRRDRLLWKGWHELLHLAVDHWRGFYEDEVEALHPLHARVGPGAKRKSWSDCVSEHMVRAATQRILLRRRGAKAQEALAEEDRLNGYVFQDALAAALEEYENNRARYPTLLDFFPKWLKCLSS
ncbi:MAG: DUF4932 domain-containing protein [Elusimicrobia bacterium]|nr:DUF4932 domain-containing protein [Elusimicrobiota bacterium]